MKANELRLGNYLDSAGELTKVVEIQEDVFYTQCDEKINYKSKWAELKPIPLTEEWLIKFGFVKDKTEITLYYKEDFEIQLPMYFKWNESHLKTIKHVHSLQNLYFALTGEELKIK